MRISECDGLKINSCDTGVRGRWSDDVWIRIGDKISIGRWDCGMIMNGAGDGR